MTSPTDETQGELRGRSIPYTINSWLLVERSLPLVDESLSPGRFLVRLTAERFSASLCTTSIVPSAARFIDGNCHRYAPYGSGGLR